MATVSSVVHVFKCHSHFDLDSFSIIQVVFAQMFDTSVSMISVSSVTATSSVQHNWRWSVDVQFLMAHSSTEFVSKLSYRLSRECQCCSFLSATLDLGAANHPGGLCSDV